MFKKGVTLMELMVIISIIGIMTAVTLVYVGDDRQKEQLKSSSTRISAHLREAQNSALTGRHVASLDVSDEKVCGFGMRAVSSGDTEYEIFYNKIANTDSCDETTGPEDLRYEGSANVTSVTQVTYHLEQNVEFANNSEDVYFTLPHGDSYIDGAVGGSQSISIKNQEGSDTYYICISETGQVTENGDATCS